MHEAVLVAGDHKATLQIACLAQADSLQLRLKTRWIRSMAETPDLTPKGMMERSLCPLLLQKAASALRFPAFPWRQSGRCAVRAVSPPRLGRKHSPLPGGCKTTWFYLVLTLYLNPNENHGFYYKLGLCQI